MGFNVVYQQFRAMYDRIYILQVIFHVNCIIRIIEIYKGLIRLLYICYMYDFVFCRC